MMPSRLMDVEGEKHFLTKRFDRDGEHKLHIQTLAALCPEADSYERLLWVCRKLNLSETACEEVFRRMVFNLLANNTDDHNKNFSFIMNEKEEWTLSPAYDMTYIFNTGGFLPETRHCLMIKGKFSDVSLDDVQQFASENGIRRADKIICEVAEAIQDFRAIAMRHGVKAQWIGAVEQTLKEHLMNWGFVENSPVKVFADRHGRYIENLRIEQQYKGNYHLLATIDGHGHKFVIRKNTPEHDEISRNGIANLSADYLKILLSKFLE